MGIIVAVGIGLIVTAVSVASVSLLGATDSPTPTPKPTAAVVVAKITPTPQPTMPPAITNTLAQLKDPALNIHISIRSTLTVNAKVTGRSQSATVTMEIDCAGGNEHGTTRTGSLGTEWMLVDGTYYSRGLPSGRWAARASNSPSIAMSPLFQLDQPRMLQYDGEETQGGILAQKIETTDWWTPDTGKLSGLDVARIGISPAHTKLIIWADSGGTPEYATFRAWTDATDGTNLLNISTTYTFKDAGAIQPISRPKI
jgi:hypothetical protein